MRMLDFGPYVRSTVGFDRMFDLLENMSGREEDNYPPYNIEKTGDDSYRIVMAVAGFAPEALSLTTRDGQLVVSGKPIDQNANAQYLHRGIGGRAFQRQFSLADYVQVTGARLENGLLLIDLKREVPEALKPRTIAITTDKVTQLGKAA